MDETERPHSFLEIPSEGATPATPRAAGDATSSWLEAPAVDAVSSEPAGGASPGGRRKARAGDRAEASVRDAVSLAIVAALPTDRTLLAALWPDLSARELLQSPPPPQALRARIEFARGAIDAVGRRDAESRARAQLAQRALDAHLARLGDGDAVLPQALAELRDAQRGEVLAFARLLAGGTGALVATDLARVEGAALERGIEPPKVRDWLREEGVAVSTVDARPWAALEALPGAPATVDDVALALLRHPAQGAELLRGGTILAWLRANGATGELVERSREARMVLERGAPAILAMHQQVWALGRRELILGSVWLRSPTELSAAVKGAHLSLDELSRAARDGVLGAWLRLQGWVAAAGAADLAARGDPSGLKRLAWSLGEPLVVGEASFTELDAFAQAVLTRAELRPATLALMASGDLLAWMESLPPALRDEVWIDRLRRGRGNPADPLPLWSGARARVGRGPLVVPDGAGQAVTLASVATLRITSQVSVIWDGLKSSYRSGELGAWLSVMAPEVERPALPWPPQDEDAELNALLWSHGHTGLVMEWGDGDRGVTAPSDLVRAYQSSWQRLEALVARGFVLTWLERFHGDTPLVAAGGNEPALTLASAVAGLRAEVPRLPAGFAALKVATLCGLRALPLDPSIPGDEATMRGYVSAAPGATSEVRAWEPLRGHIVHGSALLWLGLQPGISPPVGRALLRAAFSPWNPGADMVEHGARILAQLARSFGPPVPTLALQRELDHAAGRSTAVARHASAQPVAHRGWRGVLTAVLAGCALAGALTAGLLLWDQERTMDQPQPPADPAQARWVRLRVRVRADPRDVGGRWDTNGSPPDLRARIHVRDEVVEVGPCSDSFECEQSWERLRLVPDVPFRVRVDDMEGPFANPVGAAWARWRGRGGETLRVKLASVTVELSVDPEPDRVPSVAPSPRTSVPSSRTPPALADGGVRPRPATPRTRRQRQAPREVKPQEAPVAAEF